MYYPKGFPASAISVGWLIARANICSHSVVFCFTRRCQPVIDRSRIGPPGSALCVMVRCMSSSDSLRRRFSYYKRGRLLLMTRLDQLLSSAILSCFVMHSLDVCSEADHSSLIPFNCVRPIASQHWVVPALLLSRSQSCTSLITIATIKALQNP